MNFIPNPTVILPDVSFYQDDNTTTKKIDFVKMKAAGAGGVIIRAGQNSWVDPDFPDYWIAAKQAGLLRGTYWFYDSRSTPQTQVNLWKSVVGTDYPELGFYVDLEESYGGVYKGEANWKTFMNALDVAFPQKRKSIYTANWWWSQQVVNDISFWSKYPLWVAGYTTNPANVILPKPWTSAKLWQYTDKGNGNLYGVESLNIDLNYYNGTLEQFNLEFGVTIPPAPTTTFEPFDLYYVENGVRKVQRFIPQ